MPDQISRLLLLLNAALLAVIVAQHWLDQPVRVTNTVSTSSLDRQEGPLRVILCDQRKRCADLYPTYPPSEPGKLPTSTHWGLMTVPSKQ